MIFNEVLHQANIKKYFTLSLVIALFAVPVFDSIITQRDRNRNMAYGEVFWDVGFSVYRLTDRDLNNTYHVPEDNLMIGALNVSYEYPVGALLFYAALALIEPGTFSSSHPIVNVVMVIIAHLNLLLFLALGRNYWQKKWFRQVVVLYYCYQIFVSVIYAKTEPLTELFLLSTIFLVQKKRFIHAGAILGIAVATKFYPIMILPILFVATPIALIPFVLVVVIVDVPFLVNGGVTPLLKHLISSPNYSTMITNPFYIGWVWKNPLSLLASIALVTSYWYCITKTERWKSVPLPSTQLQSRNWKTLFLSALPLLLLFFAWVLVWYYFWFLSLIFLFDDEHSAARFRWMLAGLWIAHFIGIFVNIDYFLAGPIQELIGHFKNQP